MPVRGKVKYILFQEWSVYHILRGEKNNTRRLMAPSPDNDPDLRGQDLLWAWSGLGNRYNAINRRNGRARFFYCPYGHPGHTLYVKEATYQAGVWEAGADGELKFRLTGEYVYAADTRRPTDVVPGVPTWRYSPAIFMPRRLARLRIHVIDIKPQRLQDITRDEAVAEGFTGDAFGVLDPIALFRQTWDDLNPRAPWITNPWVWAIKFRAEPLTPAPSLVGDD